MNLTATSAPLREAFLPPRYTPVTFSRIFNAYDELSEELGR